MDARPKLGNAHARGTNMKVNYMKIRDKLIAILQIPHYLFSYYGTYWYRARIGLEEVYYLWRIIEWS